MPGILSAIVCSLNYNTARPLSTDPRFANRLQQAQWVDFRYAWGDDYPRCIWGRDWTRSWNPCRERFSEPFEARAYVDTDQFRNVACKICRLRMAREEHSAAQPNDWLLLFPGCYSHHSRSRSDAWEHELPPPDMCGSCRRCLDACPTQALSNRTLWMRESAFPYLTIE